MKKILLILALMTALCLVFASCNKDKGDGKDKNDDITLGDTVKAEIKLQCRPPRNRNMRWSALILVI